jgi:hypothetical protein
MIALSNGLSLFGEPVLLVVLIALAFAGIETERVWTRKRRRRGLDPGGMAYVLDGLVLAGVLLLLVGICALLVRTLASIARLLGGLFEGGRAGVVIVGVALALGLVWALVRIASRRRADQEMLHVGALGTPPVSARAELAEPSMAGSPEKQPDQPAPPLAMLQDRWQPGATTTASLPTSFLDLAEPPSPTAARSRFGVASSLLVLALVVLLVGGSILFRSQLLGLFSGPDPSRDAAVVTGNGEGAVQPTSSVEQPAANVSGAGLPAARAPTAVREFVAPPPADGVQSGTKRVKSDQLNVRLEPGLGQQVVLVLAKGAAVTVLTDARLISDAIWVKVRVGDQEGWVDQSFLE